jgi:hypothetical protein
MGSLLRIALVCLTTSAATTIAQAQGQVLAWGLNDSGQCEVPAPPSDRHFVELAAGINFSMGLLDDGSVLTWGVSDPAPPLPPGLSYVQVSAQYYSAVARRSDGSLVAWNGTVATLPPDTGFVQVAAAYFHTLAIRSDGSIAAWGVNHDGQLDIPPLPPGVGAVQVSGGIGHSVALLDDGTVIAWGLNDQGQCAVPAPPPGLSYVAISADGYGTLALRSDGLVVARGLPEFHDVPALPPGLTYVEVVAGTSHALARRSDGSVVAWGATLQGQCDVPELPPGYAYTSLGAGWGHSLAIRESPFTCGVAETYCESTPNSTGERATIGVWGSLAILDGDTHLWAGHCPPNAVGIFSYGHEPEQLPFANGTLCISPFYPGLFRVEPPAQVDPGGQAQLALDFANLPPAGGIGPGSTWHFQFWFRDPLAGGAGSDLTDAMRVTFCP